MCLYTEQLYSSHNWIDTNRNLQIVGFRLFEQPQVAIIQGQIDKVYVDIIVFARGFASDPHLRFEL